MDQSDEEYVDAIASNDVHPDLPETSGDDRVSTNDSQNNVSADIEDGANPQNHNIVQNNEPNVHQPNQLNNEDNGADIGMDNAIDQIDLGLDVDEEQLDEWRENMEQAVNNYEDDDDEGEELVDDENSDDEDDIADHNDQYFNLVYWQERNDSDDESEEDEEAVLEARRVVYDRALPARHDYLGTDLEDVRGRVILEDDTCVSLPLLPLPGVVLMPGQTLPLHVFPNHTVAMIRQVRDQDKTLGIVTSYIDHRHNAQVSCYGTTAEILAIKEETDEAAGIRNVKLKAIGRQRFEVKESRRQTDGILRAKVLILPERILPDALEGAVLHSHERLYGSEINCVDCGEKERDNGGGDLASILQTALSCQITQKQSRRHNRLQNANFTWWPPWVYKQYDAEAVMSSVKIELASWNIREQMPRDPVQFSYWVASMLPLDDAMKLHLLRIDHAVQRMRSILSIMQRCSVLCCARCNQYIAKKEDVFSLTQQGPMAAYVNPGGHVHETLTIYKVQNLSLIGHSSTENSWFPGYAWTIAQCRSCHHHIGWKFTSAKRGLKPEKFWGLTRTSLKPALRANEEDEEESEWQPVM